MIRLASNCGAAAKSPPNRGWARKRLKAGSPRARCWHMPPWRQPFEVSMRAQPYFLLAGTALSIFAIWQLVRALLGWPFVIGSVDIPVGASWVAFLTAFFLAVLAYLAALRE